MMSMAERSGILQSLRNSSFDDVIETLRVQLDFDYYFAVLILAVAMLTVAPITVLCNLFVIAAFCKDPNRQLHVAPSHLLLTSLALNDFIFGVLKSPLTFYYFFAAVAYKTAPFSFTVLMSVSGFVDLVSILHLLALSVDRYIAVSTPLRYAFTVTRRRTCIAVACIWCYSAMVACISHTLDNIVSFGSLFAVHVAIPWCCLTFLNGKIVYSIRKTSSKLGTDIMYQQIMLLVKRERNVFRLVLLVLSLFALCYVPWFIATILILTCSSCNLRALIYVYCLSVILTLVAPLSHPFLYTWRLPKFRKAILFYFKDNRIFNSRTDRCKLEHIANLEK